jgi:hypothetical protein
VECDASGGIIGEIEDDCTGRTTVCESETGDYTCQCGYCFTDCGDGTGSNCGSCNPCDNTGLPYQIVSGCGYNVGIVALICTV